MEFEKKLAELEKIADKMSNDKTGIEEGIALFEKSLNLTRECVEYLTEAKGKVALIKKELDLLSDGE